MKSVVRVLASLAAASAVIYTFVAVVSRPWQCNRATRSLERVTRAIAAYPGSSLSYVRAREAIESARRCQAVVPENTNLRMIEAANLVAVGRHDEAVAAYEEALRFDRRPEIFLNLGLTMLQTGRTGDGISNLFAACIYRDDLLIEIPWPQVRSDVLARVEDYRRGRIDAPSFVQVHRGP